MTTQPELPFDEYGSEATVAVTEVAPDIELDAPVTEVLPPVVEPDISPPPEEPEITSAVPAAPQTTDTLEAERARLVESQRKHEQLLERDNVIRSLEQEAVQMEQKLVNQGLSDEEAKQQTMTHLQGRVSQIHQQQQIQPQQQI